VRELVRELGSRRRSGSRPARVERDAGAADGAASVSTVHDVASPRGDREEDRLVVKRTAAGILAALLAEEHAAVAAEPKKTNGDRVEQVRRVELLPTVSGDTV
jgi:hypothetical protein